MLLGNGLKSIKLCASSLIGKAMVFQIIDCRIITGLALQLDKCVAMLYDVATSATQQKNFGGGGKWKM